MKVNLRHIATELTYQEGMVVSVSVAQVTEIMGLLAARWRGMLMRGELVSAYAEMGAFLERQGIRSEHEEL